MAAVTNPPNATSTLTPPSSDHGEDAMWNRNNGRHNTQDTAKRSFSPTHLGHPTNNTGFPSNGSAIARKMHSTDNLGAFQRSDNALSPPAIIKSQDTDGQSSEQPVLTVEAQSQWIHRDKLARIESQELKAAGIYVPRSRAPSKHRSQSRLRRGTDSSDYNQGNRTGKLSADAGQIPAWDFRTPEEIAEEEANAYFTSNGLSGGSRIPVAKTSPAPIPLDYLERGSPASRKLPDLPSDEPILYATKTRSRSASMSQKESDRMGKRSVTDSSPQKAGAAGATRKTSAPPKTPPGVARPKTRSGPGNAGSAARPPTRSGDTKPMEGDPPWEIGGYKPDPRLPPDQQIIPTVARRLQQEKLESEGKFGDVYDTKFRPLNEKAFLKPIELEKVQPDQQQPEWPLRADGGNKSPTVRQGSYSTMPKITDKLSPVSPMTSPRQPTTPQQGQPLPSEQEQMQATRPPGGEAEEKKEKAGCGCCVIM